MERLISLFKEADWEQWSPSRSEQRPPPAPPAAAAQEADAAPGLEEPLYFKQLLAHLRERKAEQERQLREPQQASTKRDSIDRLCNR